MDILTTAGQTHLVERSSGTVPTNAFDGLFLTRGNETPTASTGVADLDPTGSVLAALDSGYPLQGDTDQRNGGRGELTWTWRFTIPSGTPFVASNAALVNFNGGALAGDVGVASKPLEPIAQRFDERLIVWVNASQTEDPTIFTAFEQALEDRVQRVESFTARTRALNAWPSGSVTSDTETKARPQPGQAVWTAARLSGIDGGLLQPTEVVDFELQVQRLVGSTGQWEDERIEPIECAGHVFGAEQFNDDRWLAPGGYNVSHLWFPLPGEGEGTFRLVYRMLLCNDDVREWRTVVEVRA